jgi:formate dehydrogenase iron-sulfur subunit
MKTAAFFTDPTVCIGCKACEVACKKWNQLPDDGLEWSGLSYDNTRHLSASIWRHVSCLEQKQPLGQQSTGTQEPFRWIFMSDVCKHCGNAGCLEECPTGAILRTELGSVYVQPDVCNGCGNCVVCCPFGVIDKGQQDGRAFKCTFCYDRQLAGMIPSCAKACPTQSIHFGELDEVQEQARGRPEELRQRGYRDARIYDAHGTSDG